MAVLKPCLLISSLGLLVIRKLCQFRLIHECKTLIEPFNCKNGIWEIHPLDSKVVDVMIYEVSDYLVTFLCMFQLLNADLPVWSLSDLSGSKAIHLLRCSLYLCYPEDVKSQLCLLPTDWSFVKDVLCWFSYCLVLHVIPTEAVTAFW